MKNMLWQSFKKAAFTLILMSFFLVAVILLVNNRDRPPSEVAIKFHQSWNNKAAVDPLDNGYLYFLGFDVEKTLDPKTVGAERVQWSKEAIRSSSEEFLMFPQAYEDFQKKIPKVIKNLIDLCSQVSIDCINSINNQREFINQWSGQDLWVIGRYRELIEHKAWLELAEVDVRLPLPNYSYVMKAQRLTFIHAFSTMPIDDGEIIIDLLNQDLRFWRLMLKDTDMLIGKMIAVAAIKNNFLWTNHFLLKMKNTAQLNIDLIALNQPFTEEELSMRRCLIGEWFFAYSIVDPLAVVDVDNMTAKILIKFVYKEQDTLNMVAENLNSIVSELDVPLASFEKSLREYQGKEIRKKTLVDYLLNPYNLGGQYLSDAAPASMYTEYVVRTKDLEGFRRGLLLSIEMMSSVANKNSLYFSPYDTKPFVLNRKQQSVTAIGLGGGERAQQTYYY